ncbi:MULTISPECIES: FUSC family protein [unclassified Psychrobacter]|uniref:FUSC family protein n=1 Tax=unclassified Psychrobacter TaxID=196806 RepID=UPI0025B57647|nr:MULTISPECIES: FUSC family protein [unclassified Psychrobacter]MDN3452137.1 FUSC family protein [Psychrobacter sp. APC 3350]MDN3502380.1 FUSC family protein [Psychrobacter sp. 5A.1]
MSALKHEEKRASWLPALFARIKILLTGELDHLLTINRSQRPWHMPIIAAIAISFPVFVGAYFDTLSSGIKASLGAMIILNLPLAGTLPYRLVTVMAWGFAMVLSFSLGLIAQQVPWIRLPVFALIAFCVVILGRYYRQPPPAGLFVMMAGAIALFIPVPLAQVLSATGLVMLGSGFSMLLALLYTLFLLVTRPVVPAPVYRYESDTIGDSLIVAGFVSVALAIAVLLEMPYPYWAAMSCFIIIQGMQLRTMWIKQLHRILGTVVGMAVAGWMLSWGLSIWGVAVSILLMMLLIESLVDRHYGMAVIFITPLTIFIAEYGSMTVVPPVADAIIRARMLDTALGCAVGLCGGLAMHSERVRVPLRRLENWLLSRFS